MSKLPCSFAAKLHQNVPAVKFERPDPSSTSLDREQRRTQNISKQKHLHEGKPYSYISSKIHHLDFLDVRFVCCQRTLRAVLARGPQAKWRGSPSDHRGASSQCRCKELVPCHEARTGIPRSQSYLRSHPQHFSLVITGRCKKVDFSVISRHILESMEDGHISICVELHGSRCSIFWSLRILEDVPHLYSLKGRLGQMNSHGDENLPRKPCHTAHPSFFIPPTKNRR